MNAGGIGHSGIRGASLIEMLRAGLTDGGDVSGGDSAAQAPTVAEQRPAPVADGDSSGIMAGNFASATRKSSRYLEAAKSSFQLAKQFDNQSQSRLSALLDALVKTAKPAPHEGVKSKVNVPEATIYLLLKRIRDEESLEASERNLDEIKDGIEQKSREATAPKDESGEPIETAPVDGKAQSPPPEIPAQQSPDLESELPAQAPTAAQAPVAAAIAAYKATAAGYASYHSTEITL